MSNKISTELLVMIEDVIETLNSIISGHTPGTSLPAAIRSAQNAIKSFYFAIELDTSFRDCIEHLSPGLLYEYTAKRDILLGKNPLPTLSNLDLAMQFKKHLLELDSLTRLRLDQLRAGSSAKPSININQQIMILTRAVMIVQRGPGSTLPGEITATEAVIKTYRSLVTEITGGDAPT